MQPDREQMKLNYRGPRMPGLLTRVLAGLASVIVLIGAVAISFVLFAVVLVVLASLGAYVWWKTRHYRRELRAAFRDSDFGGGRIIEGEVIRRDDPSQPPHADRETDGSGPRADDGR